MENRSIVFILDFSKMSNEEELIVRKMKGSMKFGIIYLNFSELKIIKDSLVLYSSVNKHKVAKNLSSEISNQLSKITI